MAARGYCKIPEIAHHGVFCSRAWRVRDNGCVLVECLDSIERESAAVGAVDKSIGVTREEDAGSTMQRSWYPS